MGQGMRITRAAGLAATLGAVTLIYGPPGRAAGGDDLGLWRVYESSFVSAKYIDLTHAFAPGEPVGTAFEPLTVGAARSAVTLPGFISIGEPFSYE